LESETPDGLLKLVEASGIVVKTQLGHHLALGVDEAGDVEGLGHINADVESHGKLLSSC
jgi:hypothetical protein